MRKRLHLRMALVLACVGLSGCGKTFPVQSAAPASKRILGVSPHSNPNYRMMLEAGIGWVRLGFAFPFEDKIGGKFSPRFLANLEEAKEIRKTGLRIMGITPLAGTIAYRETDKQTAWRTNIPEWAGSIANDSYYEACERACEEIARQTQGIVDMWQVSNEMDIDVFRGPLSLEQAARYLAAGGRGVKKGNPSSKADINSASLSTNARWLFRELYSKPGTPFDYAGIDGYFGSWQPGGPQDWIPVIEEMHQITGKPVLINEWGYSSTQGSGVSLQQKVGNIVCQRQAWNRVWRKEHSLEEQAAYVAIALKIFGTYPNVVGSFFYDWGDDAVCYHCGRRGCPSECGWGLVDIQGNPKPAYNTLKAIAREYF